MYRSAKTAAILAAFMAAGGAAVMMAGCGQEQKAQGDELKDENGRTYHLVKNEDGTETAKYDNGEEVTFRRDENDNLQYVSGVSSLLPLLMMSRGSRLETPDTYCRLSFSSRRKVTSSPLSYLAVSVPASFFTKW